MLILHLMPYRNNEIHPIVYIPFTCYKTKMITSAIVPMYFETIRDIHTMKKSTPTEIHELDMCYMLVQRLLTRFIP